MSKAHFSEVIDFFKSKMQVEEIGKIILQRYKKMVNKFKELQSKKNFPISDNSALFDKVINDIKFFEEKVLEDRKAETKKLINENLEKLTVSTFELMEYNFRENTHSNILQYIFDYDFTNDFGPKALYYFLKDINDSIPDFENKLKEKKYVIERETPTGNGRIDLLIYDFKNKFIIVIENKLLSNISVYEDEDHIDEDNQPKISRTQLDEYMAYAERNYKMFDKLYLILSYKPVEDIYTPYRIINYDTLLKAINDIYSINTVVKEYKLLLHSIVNKIFEKTSLIKTAAIINDQSNDRVSLTTLEQINKLLTT